MSLPSRLLGAYPSIQVSTLLSGTLSTPSRRGPWSEGAYTYISSATPSGSTSFDLTSIPSTYKHLCVRWTARTARTTNVSDGLWMRFNNDTGSNYIFSYMTGSVASTGGSNGSTTYIYTGFNGTLQGNDGFGSGQIWILDYANTSYWKSITQMSGAVNDSSYGEIGIGGGRWNSTSAISTINFLTENSSNSWSAGSRFDLYGIAGS